MTDPQIVSSAALSMPLFDKMTEMKHKNDKHKMIFIQSEINKYHEKQKKAKPVALWSYFGGRFAYDDDDDVANEAYIPTNIRFIDDMNIKLNINVDIGYVTPCIKSELIHILYQHYKYPVDLIKSALEKRIKKEQIYHDEPIYWLYLSTWYSNLYMNKCGDTHEDSPVFMFFMTSYLKNMPLMSINEKLACSPLFIVFDMLATLVLIDDRKHNTADMRTLAELLKEKTKCVESFPADINKQYLLTHLYYNIVSYTLNNTHDLQQLDLYNDLLRNVSMVGTRLYILHNRMPCIQELKFESNIKHTHDPGMLQFLSMRKHSPRGKCYVCIESKPLYLHDCLIPNHATCLFCFSKCSDACPMCRFNLINIKHDLKFMATGKKSQFEPASDDDDDDDDDDEGSNNEWDDDDDDIDYDATHNFYGVD